MRRIMLLALLSTAVATASSPQSADAQPPVNADEIKKLEVELAQLQAKIQIVEARLRTAREVAVAFTVKSSRSLEDPSFQGILDLLTMRNRKPGQCVVPGPDLVITVNHAKKTILVRGQPEEVEAFRHLVVAFDALYALGKARGR
jgi:hypothetical protein